MKNKQIMFFVFCFILINSLLFESSVSKIYACTNFKIKDDQFVFFGNNEDHAFVDISNTFITFVPGGQVWYDNSKLKYGAVVVGYGNNSGYGWIQGGMNEKGLAWDSTSVPFTEPNLHSERPPYLVPEIFSCETVFEVVDYKKTHGLYRQDGYVQSFYVDKSGESVVYNIGLDGEFNFTHNNEEYQLATNYYVDDPLRGKPSSDSIRRYLTAEKALNNIVRNHNLTIESITQVLDEVQFQGPAANTLYSNIFDVKTGDIYLIFFHQFNEVIKLNLNEELAKGRHTIRISDLFTQKTVSSAFNEYHEYPFIIRVIPTDLLLLFSTIILDIILLLASVFVLGKKLLYRKNELKEVLKSNLLNKITSRLLLKIIVPVAITWSLLSFPMIYWNHNREWWPFFDDIPILQWPLQSFYAYHNFFLLISLLSVALITYLLSSVTRRGEVSKLLKIKIDLGSKERWENLTLLSSPILIGLIYLFLEKIGFIPKVDWLMYVIMYPVIVTMPIILTLDSKNNSINKNTPLQNKSIMTLLRTSVPPVIIWGLWFLPLLLTGVVDHMYVLLLMCLSITTIILNLFTKFS